MLATNHPPRFAAILIPFALLIASCGSAPKSTTSVPLASDSTIGAVTTTASIRDDSTTATTAEAADPCQPDAEPNVQLAWATLAGQWAELDGIATPDATLDVGDGQDSGQFTFADGTIVQATVSQNRGEVVELFVISPVDPRAPMENLSTVLDHWGDLLSLTEPRLTPQERVAILSELGVVGENLTLLEMHGTVACGQRTYEVVFDIELAAFVFGVDLEP